MAHADKAPIRFERVYDGPVEDLWALWTTKDGFETWFAPGGCRLEVSTFDVREGGAFEHVMTAVDADALAYMASAGRSPVTRARGYFVELRPHERLQMRFTMDFLPGVEPYPYDIVVEFHPQGEQVRMVVTADAHPDAEMTRLAAQTLEGQLRVFESSLLSRRGLTGLLTFGLNLTLDGCYDHRVGVADDELHDHFTQLMDAAGAMLWGRVTYELMEGAWPAVARDENAPRAMREWARKLEAKPKYVVSTTRRDFSWQNTIRLEGDLREAVTRLKKQTPHGVLVGSPALAAALEQLGLIDEYRFVVHPVFAGHGPTLFQGLEPARHLELVSTKTLKSGQVALHYRRKEGGSG
jgi:dihydrofolate reductase